MKRRTFSLAAIALTTCALTGGIRGLAEEGGSEPEQDAAGTPASDEGLKSYTVAHVESEPDWDGIPRLDIDTQEWLDPVDISAHAQLCYSDSALFVRMWAEEQDIRAEYPETDLLAKTYEDSYLEFFIAPVPGDARYLNFEFNPNCAVGAEIGTEKTNRIRLVAADDPYGAVSAYTDDGWEIAYTIPFDFIRTLYPSFSPESGMQVRGNFYKCGNLTEQKHYIAWNPVESDTPNFHLPEYFGVLVFE